jgi:myosin heavy subunit
LLKIISSILHLGNVRFENMANAKDIIRSLNKNDKKSQQSLELFSEMLELSNETVLQALISRKFQVAYTEEVIGKF